MWYNESDPALVRSPGQHHNPHAMKGAAMPEKSSKKIELARRAVACMRGRFLPGMLISGLGRVLAYRLADGWPELDVTDGRDVWTYRGHTNVLLDPCTDPLTCYIDLDDPATVGCLLALVREAWGSPSMSTGRGMGRDGAIVWGVTGHNGSGLAVATGDTEVAALVAALEAAPG